MAARPAGHRMRRTPSHLRPEVLHLSDHLQGHGRQQALPGVVPQRGKRPQQVGHLLRLEACLAQGRLPSAAVQQLRARVVAQGGKCPQRIAEVLRGEGLQLGIFSCGEPNYWCCRGMWTCTELQLAAAHATPSRHMACGRMRRT